MLISPKEIITAVAAAGPEQGGIWKPDAIATRLAQMVQGKKEMEDAVYQAWKSGQKDWQVRYRATEIEPGSAQAVADWQAEIVQANFALCDQKISQNVAAIDGIRGVITGAATTYFTGGITGPQLALQLFDVGQQIAGLLNA